MHTHHQWWTIDAFLLFIFDIRWNTVELMDFPLVLSVLKWSCEEKLGSVGLRPSSKFCTSVTVQSLFLWSDNMVYLRKTNSCSKSCCFQYSQVSSAHPQWDDQFFLGESLSRVYPNMCAKFGCGPTVASKKGGYRQTDKGTLQLYTGPQEGVCNWCGQFGGRGGGQKWG